ncbi:trypsin-like serine peptidase [Caenimonas aquaedulcis]|uniref:Serine protease n=1 Tax=Caenimonas aquaedulcis TaxID=2793270 RepID=A0A931H7I3_9BURK|nr:hypothetical protein [Caenimonas aquaedulcis]MBG9389805.1 hypothetical protein [Caenimonas aquaedulcis]
MTSAIQEVFDRTSLPYSAVCYVTVVFPDGASQRGSGVLVGPNDVLTALHMVYQGSHGGWATQVSVAPGADTSPYDTPYGVISDFGSLSGRAANWDFDGDGLITQAEAQGDMAVIGLRQRIGDAAGWLQPIAVPADFTGIAAGYPARPPISAGLGLMQQAMFADASTSYGTYDVSGSLGAGASGGPLVYTREGVSYVAGVLSSGTSNNSASTYAGVFGSGTLDWLQQAMAANDSLLPAHPQSAITGTTGADFLLGDGNDNLFTANAGDDTLVGSGGDDTLDGGDGLDLARFSVWRSAYSIGPDGGSLVVHDNQGGRDGTDRLASIERLQFTDGNLAFDLSGNAGVVARILGAVFGPWAAGDAASAGQGLVRLDAGMGEADLMQLALDVRLGAGAGNAAVVDLLYTNVTGAAPSPEVRAHFVALLDQHDISQVGLAGYAALTDLNASNIGFAALVLTGLPYLPAQPPMPAA